MDTHIQGPVSGNPINMGSVKSQRLFPLTNTNNAVAVYLDTIEAKSDLPILVKFDGYIETVFNGAGVNTITIYGVPTTGGSSTTYMATGVINPATLGWQVGKQALLRARTNIYALIATGTQATGTFTPPTSATATAVINGVSFLATFATNATTTVTNLKALIVANATINALVSLSGTTTLVVTARNAGTSGNAITTTSNNANGASWAAATLGGGANSTTGFMSVIMDATGPGIGLDITN